MKVKIKLLEEYMEQCLDFEVGKVTKSTKHNGKDL